MSKYFFCPETLGFYPQAPYGDAADKACIELSKSEYQALAGGVVVIGDDGRPTRAAEPTLSADQVAANERAWRNAEITTYEWLGARHRAQLELDKATSLTADQFSELLVYIQRLRDWPQAERFPTFEYRPVPPAWLVNETQ